MGATKKLISKKRSVKGTSKKVYDCDDVEKYLNRAINEFKKEADAARERTIVEVNKQLIPRIEIIDKRDKEQYDAAKKIMIDASIIAEEKQNNLKKALDEVEQDVKQVFETRKTLFGNIDKQFDSLNEKLDTHIKTSTNLSEMIEATNQQVAEIQNTLNNVSANGNRGLSASFTDMYSKLAELQKVTAAARARERFWNGLHDMIHTTPILKPFKTKWGAILYVTLLLLILNTVLHSLGLDFDVVSIIKWIIEVAQGRGA